MFKDYTHLGIYLYILTFLQREIYNLPSHLKISLFILYFNLPVKSLRRQKKKKRLNGVPLQKEVKHELLRPLNHNLDCSPRTVKNQWEQKQSIMGTKCSCILKNRVKQMIKVKYQKNVGIQADFLPLLFSMRIMPEYFQFRLTQKFQGHKFQKTMFRMTFGC